MNQENIKPTIIFMGTPEFSVPVLEGLIEKYGVRAIVTQPDKPVGRGGKIAISPIKNVALNHNILCLQPKKIKEAVSEIRKLKPDLIVTCAYGQILPQDLLEIPKLRCINVHASLLPKLRGGAPIHHAIMDGYTKTGITIMYMAKGMDSGDIISQKEVAIEDKDTAETLHDKLKIVGRDLLLETMPSILDGTNNKASQDESEVTYAYNISREDEKIDFNETTKNIYNKIRGLNSWPGAYCKLDGKILKVFESYQTDKIFSNKKNGEITAIYKDGFGVKASNGEIVFTKIQPEGKRVMKASDFINGYQEDLTKKTLM